MKRLVRFSAAEDWGELAPLGLRHTNLSTTAVVSLPTGGAAPAPSNTSATAAAGGDAGAKPPGDAAETATGGGAATGTGGAVGARGEASAQYTPEQPGQAEQGAENIPGDGSGGAAKGPI